MKYNTICLVYVDNMIIYGPDNQVIESEIKIPGVSSDGNRHEFGLIDEGGVGYFLGIRI